MMYTTVGCEDLRVCWVLGNGKASVDFLRSILRAVECMNRRSAHKEKKDLVKIPLDLFCTVDCRRREVGKGFQVSIGHDCDMFCIE